MPQLTRLTRALDICWSQWRSPDGSEVSPYLLTPMTARDIRAWLNGADPPRPAEVPVDWVHKESRLERLFSNGRQEIGPNEIGDVSGYEADGTRAPEQFTAIIQEPDDDPVTLLLSRADVVRDGSGRISTVGPKESADKNRAQKYPRYQITNDQAIKVSER